MGPLVVCVCVSPESHLNGFRPGHEELVLTVTAGGSGGRKRKPQATAFSEGLVIDSDTVCLVCVTPQTRQAAPEGVALTHKQQGHQLGIKVFLNKTL